MTVYVERGYTNTDSLWSYISIKYYAKEENTMIYVGIDVAKDKHDCFITNSEGEALSGSFIIQNNKDGFDSLFDKICSVAESISDVKIGLEATGHYSRNIHAYLVEKGLTTYLLNPLQTSLYRKGLSLRKTKTDKVDARTIAMMLMSGIDIESYTASSYHSEELKSLTRYRYTKVQERSKLKASFSRLVNILFPELEPIVSDLHIVSVYALLDEFPGASHVASAHLTRLSHLLTDTSKGRFTKETAVIIRDTARVSIGSVSEMTSMELRQTIRLIREYDSVIDEIEASIKTIMAEMTPPIISIKGMGWRMGSIIIAEIGDFSSFSSPDKILAYAGLSPSTYQSGQLDSSYSKMEKRGSRYLRWAILQATKYVCHWEPVFQQYLAKKIGEGKHYNVAITHAAKKLIRVMYKLQTSGQSYCMP